MMHPVDASFLALLPWMRNDWQSRRVEKHSLKGSGVPRIVLRPVVPLLYRAPVTCHPPRGIGPSDP